MPDTTLAETVARLRADPGLKTLHRSLDVYYGDAPRDAAMDKLYATILKPGDLAFDIGSHVGDRIGSFRRCDARVIALEPQPLCARIIRTLYQGDKDVTLVESACGATPGELVLHINSANPTVTTASSDFVRAAAGAGGWEGQTWDSEIRVPVTTLDALIAKYGTPRFVKIDVEGFEGSVLEGVSQPLPALSFEFTTIQREVAYDCIRRISTLGNYAYNIALGESQKLTFSTPISGADMVAHIKALPHAANSGDVYATLL